MTNLNAPKENGKKASLVPRFLRRRPLPQETIPTLRYPLAPSEDNVGDDEKSFYENEDVSISSQRVLRLPNKSSSRTLERPEQRGSKSEENELFRNKRSIEDHCNEALSATQKARQNRAVHYMNTPGRLATLPLAVVLYSRETSSPGLKAVENSLRSLAIKNSPKKNEAKEHSNDKNVVVSGGVLRILETPANLLMIQFTPTTGEPDEHDPCHDIEGIQYRNWQKKLVHNAKRFLKDPARKVDPRFANLPAGLNRRIQSRRDPLRHRADRLLDKFRIQKLNPSEQKRHEKRVAAPDLTKKGLASAPERYIPHIRPAKDFASRAAVDEWDNPLGGETQVFSLSPEEVKAKADINWKNHDWRLKSDQVLKMAGRPHINDPCIGRAPPLSREQLDRRTVLRARRDPVETFQVPETPVVPDVNPKELQPEPGSRAFVWDYVLLSQRNSMIVKRKQTAEIKNQRESGSEFVEGNQPEDLGQIVYLFIPCPTRPPPPPPTPVHSEEDQIQPSLALEFFEHSDSTTLVEPEASGAAVLDRSYHTSLDVLCDQERIDFESKFDSLGNQNVSVRSQKCSSWTGAKQQQVQEHVNANTQVERFSSRQFEEVAEHDFEVGNAEEKVLHRGLTMRQLIGRTPSPDNTLDRGAAGGSSNIESVAHDSGNGLLTQQTEPSRLTASLNILQLRQEFAYSPSAYSDNGNGDLGSLRNHGVGNTTDQWSRKVTAIQREIIIDSQAHAHDALGISESGSATEQSLRLFCQPTVEMKEEPSSESPYSNSSLRSNEGNIFSPHRHRQTRGDRQGRAGIDEPVIDGQADGVKRQQANHRRGDSKSSTNTSTNKSERDLRSEKSAHAFKEFANNITGGHLRKPSKSSFDSSSSVIRCRKSISILQGESHITPNIASSLNKGAFIQEVISEKFAERLEKINDDLTYDGSTTDERCLSAEKESAANATKYSEVELEHNSNTRISTTSQSDRGNATALQHQRCKDEDPSRKAAELWQKHRPSSSLLVQVHIQAQREFQQMQETMVSSVNIQQSGLLPFATDVCRDASRIQKTWENDRLEKAPGDKEEGLCRELSSKGGQDRFPLIKSSQKQSTGRFESGTRLQSFLLQPAHKGKDTDREEHPTFERNTFEGEPSTASEVVLSVSVPSVLATPAVNSFSANLSPEIAPPTRSVRSKFPEPTVPTSRRRGGNNTPDLGGVGKPPSSLARLTWSSGSSVPSTSSSRHQVVLENVISPLTTKIGKRVVMRNTSGGVDVQARRREFEVKAGVQVQIRQACPLVLPAHGPRHAPAVPSSNDARATASRTLKLKSKSTSTHTHTHTQSDDADYDFPHPNQAAFGFRFTSAPPTAAALAAASRRLPQPRGNPIAQSQPTKNSFLGNCLAADGVHPAEMDSLQVRTTDPNSVKTKAVEDARQMQTKVIEECAKSGKDPPPYCLIELIGKGSFGRVYKGRDMKTAATVAVKIIDIDESDTLNPRNANSYSEFLKEINALKLLSEHKAKNINHILEALPVGKAMWMITEHCGGGSVATLMKPTMPNGLLEKWIIPILREVAEGLKWVHQAGIIHRDIKCANVLVTEEGGVQLCDFGVAGIIETKLDKRSTIIGTPHWMAPELFDANPNYGKEVDIWALGAFIYELATSYPPNVTEGISYDRLGAYLKSHVPRLEGGNYSEELRNIVAFCLEEQPSARPTIEQVQKHPYIANTSSQYPTSSLARLVVAFRGWEAQGGSRKSLFMQHGAQPYEPLAAIENEWNFSTTQAFETNFSERISKQDLLEAYGPSVVDGFNDETARPGEQQQTQKGSRRRPPPGALREVRAPLEKIFDPNTISNYEDNSRDHYGKQMPSSTSDLPLRDDSAQTSIRDTMIDLGGVDSDGLWSFLDRDTIKANRRRDESEDEYGSSLHDFSRPPLSDPADINTNRRTQDWKFPTMAPPASADPELSRFPISYEIPRPMVTPGSGGRPALIHHPTEPIGGFGGGLSVQPAIERLSMRESLIDLDMSLPDSIPEFRRPSTANSDVGSATSEQMPSGNPFELERHTSLYQPAPPESGREPSIYVTEESSVPLRLRTGNPLQDLADMSDFSASDVEAGQDVDRRNGRNGISQYDGTDDSDYLSMPPPPRPTPQTQSISRSDQGSNMARFPELPDHPSTSALTGTASQEQMKNEIDRMLGGMIYQLEAFKDVYDEPTVLQRVNSGRRRER